MIIYLKNRLRDYWVFIIAALFIVVSRGEVPAVKMVILLMVEFFCILIPGEIFLRFTKITFKNGAASCLSYLWGDGAIFRTSL